MLGDFRELIQYFVLRMLILILVPGIFIYLVVAFKILGLIAFIGVSSIILYVVVKRHNAI